MQKKLRILFPIRSTHLIHNHRSIVEELLSRGHELCMVVKDAKMAWADDKHDEPLLELAQAFRKFSYKRVPLPKKGLRYAMSNTVNAMLTYRRYLLVRGQSVHYLDRYFKFLPLILKLLMKMPGGQIATAAIMRSHFVGRTLRVLADVLPPDKDAMREIRAYKPDVLLISGGSLAPASMDAEYLKAGVGAKILTVLPAISWDYLTTKTLIYPHPDLLLVWNAPQIEEAATHHGIPREKISVIGSAQFDGWFKDLGPSMAREEFGKKNGLDISAPFIVYLGSSFNVAQDERWLVEKLVLALRSSGNQTLQKVQVVLRPHPMNYKYYQNFNLPWTAIIPKQGAIPDTREARQLFFDTVYFSSAVIGINTSAMLESAILGKPLISFIAERYQKTQSEAVHFQALLRANAMELVSTPEEFSSAVTKILHGKDLRKEAREKFVLEFIRPQGLNKSAGSAAADEIEKLARYKYANTY